MTVNARTKAGYVLVRDVVHGPGRTIYASHVSMSTDMTKYFLRLYNRIDRAGKALGYGDIILPITWVPTCEIQIEHR